MKKILLSFAAISAAIAASAAVSDLTKVWEQSIENAFKADAKVWHAPVAVDAEGNVIATGAYTEDFTLGQYAFEAVGTSAYVVKYDKAGTAIWSVSFTGAATITAIDTDADGNIYIAGTFADEVSFGTTSGDPIVKEGMKVDDAFTAKQNASFIAKYSADGALSLVETYVPEIQPTLEELIGDWEAFPMYIYEDGDVRFYISNIKVVDSKIYASATGTGITKIGDKTFDSGYVCYSGFMYADNLKATLFSLDTDELAKCDQIVIAGDGSENGDFVEDTSSASSIKFDVNGDNIFVSVIGAGNIMFNDVAISAQTVPGESSDDVAYVFINTLLDGTGAIKAQNVSVGNANSNANSISNVFIADDKALVVGKIGTTDVKTEGEGEDATKVVTEQKAIFVNSISLADELTDNLKTFDVNPNDYFYSIPSSALLPGGEVYINFRDDEVATSYVFANDAFAAATTVSDAIGVAAAGNYVAFSQIGETGAVFSLYTDDSAGIADIVADENAPVEFFNLQGVRVANPENGLYIIRQGGKATKAIIK